MLYPLKFKPLYKERIWGGNKIETVLGKKPKQGCKVGECWELSAVQGSVSVVANGALRGNSIEELIEVYMGDLVGDKVYEQFGVEFPLLIKLLDAADVLSIQVHPGDELARRRHNAYGKTEMWYVVDSEPDGMVYLGFREGVDREVYLRHLADGTLSDILNRIPVEPGMVYFIPAGTIHAIGKGVLVVEIQQTSDITYRVFDWNRVDDRGKSRTLHSELALDALNLGPQPRYKVDLEPRPNAAVKVKTCDYFTTNLLWVERGMERDYHDLDSFVAYVCLEGAFEIVYGEGREAMRKGETVLLPAEFEGVRLEGDGKVLETYIP